MTFREQFLNGVRWFDIRVNGENGSLFHGKWFCRNNLSNVLSELATCLREHISEGVICYVSYESDNGNPDGTGHAIVKAINEFKSKYPDHFAMLTPDMTVGQLRNRIGFVFDDHFLKNEARFFGTDINSIELDANHNPVGAGMFLDRNKYGIPGMDKYDRIFWVHDKAGNKIARGVYRQDLWKTFTKGSDTNPRIHQKTQLIRECLRNKVYDNEGWAINNTSAYVAEYDSKISFGVTGSYPKSAWYQNDRTAQYIIKSGFDNQFGVIVMDYAGVSKWDNIEVYGNDLVDACIEHNFFGSDVSKYSVNKHGVNITIP